MNTMASSARASTSDSEAALGDIADRGAAAIRDAKTSIDDAVSNATEKGQEALRSASEARDSVAEFVLTSIKERPYTTLAVAGFIGFLYGAMRRR